MEKKKENIRVVSLSNEKYTVPKPFISIYNDIIRWGENNLYPDYLLDCFNNKSSKHKSIINRKVLMTTGLGIEENISIEASRFIQNPLNDDYTLIDIVNKLNYDLEIYGGFCCLVYPSLDNESIAKIEYMDFRKVRKSINSDDEFYISKDWSNIRKECNRPLLVKTFNPDRFEEDEIQLYYYIESNPGSEYYPIPQYSSSLSWIEMDYEISNFHLNSIKNGFMPSFLINFATGIPTEEEMEMIYDDMNKKFSGSTNAGRLIMTFCEGSEQNPTFQAIETNSSDDKFLMLHEKVTQEILIAHSITNPILFGIKTEGQLGGRTELLESLSIFQSIYISQKQKIFEKFIEEILKVNNIQDEIKFKKYSIDFSNIEENNK